MKPVLVIPNLDKKIRVEVDTSDFAMGRVLSIKCEDKKWRPVAYILKLLSKAERNYNMSVYHSSSQVRLTHSS